MSIATTRTGAPRPAPRRAEPVLLRLRGLDPVSCVVAAVMAVTSAAGAFVGGVYRDNAWSTATFRGTDAATLFVATPTLLLSPLMERRGSLVARLGWLGALAYNVYNYAFYVFGTAFNDYFLLYAFALGASLAVFVLSMVRVVPVVAADARAPYRLVGAYLVAVGAAFGLVWTVQSLEYVVNGALPERIANSGIHTSIVFGLDLTLVVPWLVMAVVLMWRRTRAGVALAVVMNVLAVLYMTALGFAGEFAARAGTAATSWRDPPYLEIGVASLAALVLLAPHVRQRDRGGAE